MAVTETAAGALLLGIMVIYAILVVLALVRAVSGPRVADRLMAINMVGTIGIFLMAVTAVKLGEDYLLDICIIYAMISFLSVSILTKVYMGVHEENMLKRKKIEMQRKEKEEPGDSSEWDELLRGLQ
ncbi:MAG: sodium:proton antiporter [Lachnospiraceae bacterium]|nr:sodium:proton antiporter [Lachnospiraceae bacterium]MBR6469935.1 sodium:proton antiporter [Lachnospiraceae bacterium]